MRKPGEAGFGAASHASRMILLLSSVAVVALALTWRRHAQFEHRPAPERAVETREHGTLRTVRFAACDGVELEAWLVTPKLEKPPVVLLAPGLTGTKEALEPYAWAFAEAGVAAVLLDFRTLGGSGGTPRHWVDPFRQLEDYRSALEWIRNNAELDGSRIALWGSSFSGGVALTLAADDERIKAVIAQCPFLETTKEQEPTGLAMARFIAAATLDSLGAWPVYVPALGQPGEFAFGHSRDNPSVENPIARPGAAFWQSLPKQLRGGWENKFLARMLTRFDRFQPMAQVERVRCPVLFVAAEADDMVPLEHVRRAHSRAGSEDKALEVLPCAHFDLYVGPHAEKSRATQSAFLARALQNAS